MTLIFVPNTIAKLNNYQYNFATSHNIRIFAPKISKPSHNEKNLITICRWSVIVRGLLQGHNRNTNQIHHV